MRPLALALALALALPGRASADPTPARPDWMWTLGGLLRVTSADLAAERNVTALDEYGWAADAPVLAGLRGDLAYLNTPIVDVGVAWAYARGTYAALPSYPAPDELGASTTEFGLLARTHWVRPGFPVAAEPRVEAGLARTRVDLRGRRDAALGTYLRAGLDLRAGAPAAGIVLSIDYTHARADTMVPLPTGGVSVGLSFYWRRWPSRP